MASMNKNLIKNVYNNDKNSIIQDISLFSKVPINVKKCASLLTRILSLLNSGDDILTEAESTEIFFGTTRLFESDDERLRRLVYLLIKSLPVNETEVFIVTSSLTKDINSPNYIYRANAIRVICYILNGNIPSQIERYMKSLLVDVEPYVSSSTLLCCIGMFNEANDLLRRWISEITTCLSNNNEMVRYHATILLFLLKANDKQSLRKLITTILSGNAGIHTRCFIIKFLSINNCLLDPEFATLVNRSLNHKSDAVKLEAIKAIITLIISITQPSKIVNSHTSDVNSLRPPHEVSPAVSSSPPEVHPAVSSSNYLSLKGRATPGDRGGGNEVEQRMSTRKNKDVQPLRTGNLPGGTKDVNPEEQKVNDYVTSSGTPAADLREAEGQLNKGAVCKTTSGRTEWKTLDVKNDGKTVGTSYNMMDKSVKSNIPSNFPYDIKSVVLLLRGMIKSGDGLKMYVGMNELNKLADVVPELLKDVNKDIELLISNKNKLLSSLSLLILLKIGNNDTIDNLLLQSNKINSDLKLEVVKVVKRLCVLYPDKYKIVLKYLSLNFRNESSYKFKNEMVDATIYISTIIQQAQVMGICNICEFIEDCEYMELNCKMLKFLGDFIPKVNNPNDYIRFIFNRLILESSYVRCSAINALDNIAKFIPELHYPITIILQSFIHEHDHNYDLNEYGTFLYNFYKRNTYLYPEVTTPPSTRHGGSPPEVTTSVPLGVEPSSNYLPVNGIATPGDRGDVNPEEQRMSTPKNKDVLPGGTENVNPEEQEFYPEEQASSVVDVTSSGEPVADLREAEGQLNREGATPSGMTSGGGAQCNGKDGPQVEAVCKTKIDGVEVVDDELVELYNSVNTNVNINIVLNMLLTDGVVDVDINDELLNRMIRTKSRSIEGRTRSIECSLPEIDELDDTIDQFFELRYLIDDSQPITMMILKLTEDEEDYNVNVNIYFMGKFILFEFIIINTLDDQNLENLHINIDLKSTPNEINWPIIYQNHIKKLTNTDNKIQILLQANDYTYNKLKNIINHTSTIQTNDTPPEVTTTVPLAVEGSSNYLPVNGNATPGDRGDDEVNDDVTSSGEPVADLREAEGEVNREATTASGKTSGEDTTMENGCIVDMMDLLLYGNIKVDLCYDLVCMTGECYYNESYSINSINMGIALYMAEYRLNDFHELWSELSLDEEVGTFQLQFKSVEDAYNVIIKYLGMYVMIDELNDNNNIRRMNLSGKFLNKFLIIGKGTIAQSNYNNCLLKLQLRCKQHYISHFILKQFE